jgi:hypothetical protein
MSRAVFLIIFVVSASIFTVVSQIRQGSSVPGENVMVVQDTAFAFGWSGLAGEKWTVNNQSIILNNKAMATPSPTPINGDAGPIQINPYVIYANNIGFSYGWDSNVTERYSPSTSMATGTSQAFNGKGPVVPPSTPINQDAGISQNNPALIYLNGIGFSFGWSSNSSDNYRPSPTMEVGSPTSFDNNALIMPSSWTLGIDNTPPVTSENYDGLWHNVSFTITLSAFDNESGVAETYYRINGGQVQNVSANGQPFITTEGSNNTLEYWSVDNANNTELPHKFLFGIKLDRTSPVIWAQTRTPGGNVTANQQVTISANVTDALSGVKSVRLEYNVSNSALWLDFPMSLNSTTGLYEYTIPGQPAGAIVKYKITAYDYAGNVAIDDNAGQYYSYVVAIPEFSSLLVLPLLMMVTLLAAITYRKRSGRKRP